MADFISHVVPEQPSIKRLELAHQESGLSEKQTVGGPPAGRANPWDVRGIKNILPDEATESWVVMMDGPGSILLRVYWGDERDEPGWKDLAKCERKKRALAEARAEAESWLSEARAHGLGKPLWQARREHWARNRASRCGLFQFSDWEVDEIAHLVNDPLLVDLPVRDATAVACHATLWESRRTEPSLQQMARMVGRSVDRIILSELRHRTGEAPIYPDHYGIGVANQRVPAWWRRYFIYTKKVGRP